MLIRGDDEGEVSGDFLGLGLFLLMIIAIINIIGAMNTPPGTKSIIIPTTNGTHQCLPSPCLDEIWVCFSGIRVLEWGLG